MSSSPERPSLGPEVEALQPPPADPPAGWQENLFFILWDDEADTGFLTHVQRVPGRDEQEARVVVVVDGAVASSTLVGPYGPSPVPGMSLEPLDPFRAWRVALTADLSGVPGPLGLLTLDGPGDVPVHVDLQLRSELPVVDFAAALDDMVGELRANAHGPQMGRQEHYEQGGTWTGTLRVGDREVRGSGLFVRDHSWGVRSEQQRFQAFWTASCLDGGRRFCNAIGIPSGDRIVGIGAVADADGVRFTREVSARFDPAPGIASYDAVEVGFGAGIDSTLHARTRRHVPIPLPHSGPGRYDNNAIAAVRMDGMEGFGVMEWAATFSEAEAAALPAAVGVGAGASGEGGNVELTDPTDTTCEPTRYWSTANVGEATPDVLSPMCWSFWGSPMEEGGRLAYLDFGILTQAETAVPVGADRLMTAHFRGRPALNLDLLRSWFDSMPGTSADDFERDICGSVRPGLPPEPRSGRTFTILRKVPGAMLGTHRLLRTLSTEQAAWWTTQVLEGGGAADPMGLLHESVRRFRDAFRVHVRARFVLMAIQGQLTTLAEAAGRGDLVVQVLSGLGGVTETSVADDLWRVGRHELPVEEFIRRHGFHGANEGNATAVVWREQPGELTAMAAALAARPDAERPLAREAAGAPRRTAAIAELLAAVPRTKRPVVRLLCRMSVRSVQDLELGKASYLRAIDGGRLATRLLGARLVAAGVLEDPEDAFSLTVAELSGGVGREHRELIAYRRACRERHRAVELPPTFTGTPVPVDLEAAAAAPDEDLILGVGGAPGIVEGSARVVLDANAADPLEPGEILVCRFTDPSWAPMFSLADALVIDIGASASHGAIVARELGVPCVIGTNDGTRRIRDGDRLRVDGTAGRVEVLERAVVS